jgi:carbon dioxide concentrating mechanism protein CcmN
MHLPSIQPISSEIYVNGDVIIHESAVIAPGTILQAAPDSYIIIGPRVCLGMGVILNACQGVIEIEEGAVLGNGVLIIGGGKIGKSACIGSLSTIFNSSVAAMTIIAPGSILGDSSRPIQEQDSATKSGENTRDNAPEPQIKLPVNNQPDSSVSGPEVEVTSKYAESEPSSEVKPSPVVGQVYINQLLLTLFPERSVSKNPVGKNSSDNPQDNLKN